MQESDVQYRKALVSMGFNDVVEQAVSKVINFCMRSRRKSGKNDRGTNKMLAMVNLDPKHGCVPS